MTSYNIIPPNKVPVPGWKGGFSTSDPAFAYPDPNLSSLDLLDNMANIDRLERQVHALWPEFSWLTKPDVDTSRCFQMFAPDISRLGYDATGRVWSIICPQQGSASPTLGSLNIEVTVTGQRGWVDETVADRNVDLFAADMTVTGKVWLGPNAKTQPVYAILEEVFALEKLPFPIDKANAIQVGLHRVGDPNVPIVPVRSGLYKDFKNPLFALHDKEAWGVANVEVEIGPIASTGSPAVDDFNAIVMDFFNLASGNILKAGNVLTWNVWFDAPTLVDREEWKEHAIKWRESIDADHGAPEGPGTKPRYFDGTPFVPLVSKETELATIDGWLKRHFGRTLPADIAA